VSACRPVAMSGTLANLEAPVRFRPVAG
jgi:hypothetical protein